MDAVAAPAGLVLDPGFVSLAALSPGTAGRVVGVGSPSGALSPLERRLLELGFVSGEHVEVLAEARPGRDPFVVRVGHTTLALRRREAESIWVEIHHSGLATSPPEACEPANERLELRRAPANERLELRRAPANERLELRRAPASERVELHRASSPDPAPAP